ncbi:hypothetical protein ACHQM5_025498 [Ranunculus cassubicifolius]
MKPQQQALMPQALIQQQSLLASPQEHANNLGQLENEEEIKNEMEGKTMKQVILVQILTRADSSEFYIVDLGLNQVLTTPFATLCNEGGLGRTLCLGPVLYNVGGNIAEEAEDCDHDITIPSHGTHLGVSCLELNVPHLISLMKGKELQDEYFLNKWKAAPLMQNRRGFPVCASLGGRIYALGGLSPNFCIGEVFSPPLGPWEALSPPPSNLLVNWHCVSYPVIPDEKNERLLVHFRHVKSLYAYYPATGKWDCLAENFSPWKKATALVDDVLYIHYRGIPYCLVAYDLLAKVWLNIEDSSFLIAHIRVPRSLYMLNLGDGVLCLANSYVCHDENSDKTHLQFVKFRVERTSPSEVRITRIVVHRFPFEGYRRVFHFCCLK